MTQDQYGQGEGAGAVRGDVAAGDETEDTAGQSRPMTRFQKVASALLGDRSDRDEADQEEATRDDAARDEAVAGNRAPTASEMATDSDVMAPGSTTSAAGTPAPGAPGRTPTWTPANNADEAAAASSPAGPAGSVGTAGPADQAGPAGAEAAVGTGMAGSEAAATRPGRSTATAGTEQRDYWDEPDASAADRDETVVVPPPAAPVGDTGTDPLAPGNEAGPEGTIAEDYAATEPDMYGTTARPGDAAPAEDAAPTAGAATIADVPAAGGTTGPAGRHAAGPAEDEVRDLRPGEATGALGDFSDLTYGNLIPDAEQYTAQWQQVQFRFVDDPRGAVTEAADLVAQVTAKLEAAIQERQRAIEERQRAIQEQQRSLRGRWGEGTNTDTEALRETLRMYRMFLDQLIGSKTS